MMRQYTAVLKAVFEAPSDVDAILIAENVRELGLAVLSQEDDDSIDVVDVSPTLLLKYDRIELVRVMRKTRNMLIATRIRQCFDLAREIDKTAWILDHRAEEHFDVTGYNYGDFMTLARRITGGINP